ncbi:hypothetical protein FN846DRAFT_950264 [Sphaerosporella brunnea]|uniref:Uncharacterized protein n=1 Tax=Sphaerosporella brunnea TaxID=1250544 RepID=A0A5J5EXG3_9PEZI|nr:hypothetical protein FN846DRAFT_950264 [Sphaerosporella brunnea]
MSKTPLVFRIQNVPSGVTSDGVRAAIRQKMAPAEMALTVKVTLSPSCRDDGSQTGLLEFSPNPPNFLNSVASDALGVEEYQLEMDDGDINIDRNFYGLTALYPNPDGLVIADIVAVTDGHAYGSWRGRGNLRRMWLRDFLGPEFPYCRTMIYGYDSKLQSHGVEDITDYKRSFLEELRKARSSPEQRHRPLIFIAHSFGAMLVCQLLVKARGADPETEPVLHALFRATRATLFFGAPHRGLILDDVLSMLQSQPQAMPRAKLVEQIQKQSDFLVDQLEMFVDLAEAANLQVVSFYETRQTRRLQQQPDGTYKRTGDFFTTLDKSSALLNIAREKKFPVAADHSTMVKFDHKSVPTYTTILEILRGIMPPIPPNPAVQNQGMLNESLLTAASIGDTAAVARLLLSGAETSALDRDEQTPLHLAALGGHVDVARLLLDAGAIIDWRTRQGRTPLYFAARAGKLGMVELLVERGADINANRRSWTPLITAARNSRPHVVYYLVKEGADPHLAAFGMTPKKAAELAGCDEIVRFLSKQRIISKS